MLLALLCLLLFLDNVCVSALPPLLPHFSDTLGLSASALGLLTAAYTVAGVAFALPAGYLARRLGVKTAVLMGGVVLAAGTATFAVAADPLMLGIARFTQGVGSVVSWVAGVTWLSLAVEERRRSEAIAYAGAAGIVGVIAGPLVGGLSAYAGRLPVFMTIAAIVWLVLVLLAAYPGPRQQRSATGRPVRQLLSKRSTQTGLALLLVAGTIGGGLSILTPLGLAHAGMSLGGIVVFFVVVASAEAAITPLIGRWADQGRPIVPIRWGLVVLAPTLALILGAWSTWPYTALTFVAVVVAGAFFWVPATVLSTREDARFSSSAGPAFALATIAWLAAHTIGTSLAGLAVDRLSDTVAYLAMAMIAIATLALSGRWSRQ